MTPPATRPDLEMLVKNFGPFRKQTQVLEQRRLLILELRARGGSYPQIRQLLTSVGLHVSDASLSKFCCKYAAEVARLRLQMEQEFEGLPSPTSAIPSAPYSSPSLPVAISHPISTLSPMSSTTRKMRDLRGGV